MLQTTSVGSFPKPAYLIKARARFAGRKISREELRELELKATREIIEMQERVGIDILVHGEMERGDMATYFAEKLDGFAISGPVGILRRRWQRAKSRTASSDMQAEKTRLGPSTDK